MFQRLPDRGLRRAVTRLRSLPGKDFDAVLSSLDGAQRSRVLGLLDELEGRSVGPAIGGGIAFDEVVLPPNLSPWLVARINGRGDGGDETMDRFEITAHAQTELRRCAAALVPQPASPRTTSLMGRIAGFLSERAI